MTKSRSIFWTGVLWTTLVIFGAGGAEAQVVAAVDVLAPSPTARALVITGWAFDQAAPVDGIRAIDVYAWHLRGDGSTDLFFPLGAADIGIARPEVASRFGIATTHSGFTKAVSYLSAGTWLVRIIITSAHGSAEWFDRVTLGSPLRQWIDLPAAGSTQAGVVYVTGWALDASNAIAPGIDSIAVCARNVAAPELGCTPVANATLGNARPDVAAAFGGQFVGAGYYAIAIPLPPGLYDFHVIGRAREQQIVSVVRVRIQ